MTESRDRLIREEPLTPIFTRRSVSGFWIDNDREEEEEMGSLESIRATPTGRIRIRRRRRREENSNARNTSSLLPSWYPRRHLRDITAVIHTRSRDRRGSSFTGRVHRRDCRQGYDIRLVSTRTGPLSLFHCRFLNPQCGCNSTMDTICAGVPILSWPFFGDQTTNCRYACVHWGIGMEIDKNVKRDEVEVIVRELMEGEKGKKMMEKAMEWKKSAEEATKPGGSSYVNLDKLINDVLLLKKQV